MWSSTGADSTKENVFEIALLESESRRWLEKILKQTQSQNRTLRNELVHINMVKALRGNLLENMSIPLREETMRPG